MSDALRARVIAVSDRVDAEAGELVAQLGETGEVVLHVDEEVAALFNAQPEKFESISIQNGYYKLHVKPVTYIRLNYWM